MPAMTIDTTDTRTMRALAALPSSGQWLKVRDQSGRALAYGVPSASQLGRYHFANSTECTCEDHKRGHHCWHSRAVAMHVASLKAPRRNLTVSSRANQRESVTSAVAHEANECFWRRFED
jgi:hypothetical protein